MEKIFQEEKIKNEELEQVFDVGASRAWIWVCQRPNMGMMMMVMPWE
jgi:hypothetical protein